MLGQSTLAHFCFFQSRQQISSCSPGPSFCLALGAKQICCSNNCPDTAHFRGIIHELTMKAARHLCRFIVCSLCSNGWQQNAKLQVHMLQNRSGCKGPNTVGSLHLNVLGLVTSSCWQVHGHRNGWCWTAPQASTRTSQRCLIHNSSTIKKKACYMVIKGWFLLDNPAELCTKTECWHDEADQAQNLPWLKTFTRNP